MSRFRYYKGVPYVAANKPAPNHFTTCGTCHRSWDDTKSTGITPTPAGRCPFEGFKGHDKGMHEDVSYQPIMVQPGPKWENDHLQFARLIAECIATGAITINDELMETMDLPAERINEIMDRAQAAWDDWKAR